MRQYTIIKSQETVEEKKVSVITCNQCGKEILLNQPSVPEYEDEFTKAAFLSVDQSWGYGSQYDLEHHEFDLCESCYEKLIEGFQVPIQVEEILLCD